MSTKLLPPLLEALDGLNEGRATIGVIVVDLEPNVMHEYAASFDVGEINETSKFDKCLTGGAVPSFSRPLQKYVREIHREVQAKVNGGVKVIILSNHNDGLVLLKM